MPAESAARVVPRNLRRLMLRGAIGLFVIFFLPRNGLTSSIQDDGRRDGSISHPALSLT